jgi:cGMP-dependent protein kinase
MALLNNAIRQASVRAVSSCRLWSLSRLDFRHIANSQECKKLEDKMRFLKGIEFFEKLLDSSLEKIAEVMVLKSYSNGKFESLSFSLSLSLSLPFLSLCIFL